MNKQSDFLGNLSARGMHNGGMDTAGGRLIPRLPSRFEPLANQTTPTDRLSTVDNIFNSSDIEILHEGGTPAKFTPLAHEQSDIQSIPLPQNDQKPVATLMRPIDIQEIPTQPVDRDSSQVTPVQIEPTQVMDHPEMPPAIATSKHSREFSEPDRSVDRTIEVYQPDNHKQLPRAYMIPVKERRDMSNEGAITSTPINQIITTFIPERIEVARGEWQSLKSEAGPQFFPITPVRKLPTSLQESAQQAPTIQVTIGRVEVRTSTPPLSPRRNQPASSTMCLDEYLRRRKGEER